MILSCTKTPCLIRGGSCNFQPSFRDRSVSFVPKGGGGLCAFYPPTPHPILFDQSLIRHLQVTK